MISPSLRQISPIWGPFGSQWCGLFARPGCSVFRSAGNGAADPSGIGASGRGGVRHGAKAADLRGAVATGECGGFFFKVSYFFLNIEIETHSSWDPLI